MNMVARLAVALLCWVGAAGAGWWWHRPDDAPQPPAAVSTAASAAAEEELAPSPQAMARRVALMDPMGLSRNPAAAPAGGAVAPTGANSVVWRLAALVVRGGERYAVLTSVDQVPLRLRVNETLPDGDRIKAIHADRIDIQSQRGRLRTLYMTHP